VSLQGRGVCGSSSIRAMSVAQGCALVLIALPLLLPALYCMSKEKGNDWQIIDLVSVCPHAYSL